MSIFFYVTLWSQIKTITGTVTDDKDAALSGATVPVKNRKTTATTNAAGVFSVNVSPNVKTIVVTRGSCIGRKNALTISSVYVCCITSVSADHVPAPKKKIMQVIG